MIIIGLVLLVAFWIFMMFVTGTILGNNYLTSVPDIDGFMMLFGSTLWPITLLILAGLYVGNYLSKAGKK